MKKLRLNLQQMENAEVLTRSQLRNVLGGGGMETTQPGGGIITTGPGGSGDLCGYGRIACSCPNVECPNVSGYYCWNGDTCPGSDAPLCSCI